jgi:hypothetical protein
LRDCIQAESYTCSYIKSELKVAFAGFVLGYVGLVISFLCIYSDGYIRSEGLSIVVYFFAVLLAFVGCVILWTTDIVSVSTTPSIRSLGLNATSISAICGSLFDLALRGFQLM